MGRRKTVALKNGPTNPLGPGKEKESCHKANQARAGNTNAAKTLNRKKKKKKKKNVLQEAKRQAFNRKYGSERGQGEYAKAGGRTTTPLRQEMKTKYEKSEEQDPR